MLFLPCAVLRECVLAMFTLHFRPFYRQSGGSKNIVNPRKRTLFVFGDFGNSMNARLTSTFEELLGPEPMPPIVTTARC